MTEITDNNTTSPSPVLRLRNITKSFPGVKALKGVSFDVLPGEVHALVGENGAGKSTLMKVMAGAYIADSGEIEINGDLVEIRTTQRAIELGVNIIYQELNLVPHLTVAENIFLGREPKGLIPGSIDFALMEKQAQEIMVQLGASINVRAPIRNLSVAQQQMVEIAKATSRKSRLIAMDEPSATLTEHELENLWKLIGKLKSAGVAIVYISHRLEEIFMIADRVTVLRDGETIKTCNVKDVNTHDLVRMMVGRKVEDTFPKVVAKMGEPVLEVRGLTRTGVLRDINLTVHAGEVVALAGLVGSGRTEVARCIFGADKFDSGEMRLFGKPYRPRTPKDAIKSGIGFVTEDRKLQGLVLPMSVRENTTLSALEKVSRFGVISYAKERDVSEHYVKSLGTKTPTIEQRVRNLSGGNQQKVVLSKWLMTDSKLLILDEPTRGIDVGAKAEIYLLMNELAARGIAILMISSELPEVIGMADRVIVMKEGIIVGEIPRTEASQESVGHLAVG
jgi:ribose transport system ATP-binding protein